MNLLAILEGHAITGATRVALIHGTRSLTYGALYDRVRGLASELERRGIGPEKRVLLFVPMSLELYVCFLAVLYLGATVVFIDPGMGRAGIAAAAERCRPDLLLAVPKVHWLRWLVGPLRRIPMAVSVGKSFVDGVPPIALGHPHAVDDGAPALLTFTSGTTGAPKGTVRSHGFLIAQHRALQEILKLSPDDVDMPGLPVFVLNALAAGSTCVIPPIGARVADVDAGELVRLIEAHRVTTVEGSPVIAEAIGRECKRTGRPLTTVRGVFSGGAPVLPALHEALRPWLPHGDSVVVYGSTEAEPISAVSGLREVPETVAATNRGEGLCVGVPVSSVRVRLDDDEILVAGGHVNESYLDDAEAEARFKVRDADGTIWHRTGDAGRMDDRGRLWLLGRVEHRLSSPDGSRIYPTAVETAARAIEGVRQAALVEHAGKIQLVVEGAGDESVLRRLHPAIEVVRTLASIPTDRRHNAKIDYVALRKLL